ncbi:hypothetical protein [Clostridium perfringens]|uniref:hypothetical protein n=1 Tax=Clostridium perfringens TaxID=1502 RepID=UPI0024BC0411|nr:hypothetical protein [Clostridium perfringens]
MDFKDLFLLLVLMLVLIFNGYIYINGKKKRELSVEELNKKYEFTLTIKTKDGAKTELKLFSNWKYKSEDILNFFINKELQSIEYKKNGNSILIPISEVKSYEFRVKERSK